MLCCAPTTCRQPSAAAEVQGLPNVELTQLDLASPASIEAWAAQLAQLAPHCDLLINNAGIYPERARRGLPGVCYEDMIDA